MNCRVCNFQIPAGVISCPRCGTGVAPYASNPDNQPGEYDPTIAASYMQQTPPTSYGSDPYNAAAAQQYNVNPYNAPPTSYAPTPTPAPNNFVPPQGYAPMQPPAPNNFIPSQGYAPTPTPGMPQYGAPVYQQAPVLPNLPPSRVPTRPPGNRLAVISVLVLLAVLVLGGGGFWLLSSVNHPVDNRTQANTTATATANQPTATPAGTPDPSKNPYAPSTGTLLISDPMHDNSKGYKWDETTMHGTKSGDTSVCGFKDNTYHISRTIGGNAALSCNPEAAQLTLANVAIEARLTVNSGTYAGVIARIDQTSGKGYLVRINVNGSYEIDKMNFGETDMTKEYSVLRSGDNKEIVKGTGQANLVALIVNADTISIYINNTFADTIKDTTFTSGQLGFYGASDNGPADISVTDVRAWKL